MASPVIIFGAGASHDVINRSQYDLQGNFQPPLTVNLFDKKWDNFLHNYQWLPRLLPKIRQAITMPNANLEQFLDEFKSRIQDLPQERQKLANLQLIDLQLYLRQLFQSISSEYLKKRSNQLHPSHSTKTLNFNNSNNYVTFLDTLKDSGINQASIITFNYDLFLDRAFELVYNYDFVNMQSYYKAPIKFYKVHGSVSWFYPGHWNGIGERPSDQSSLIEEIIRTQNSLKKDIAIINKHSYTPSVIQVPCLAVPLPQDKDFIVEEHRTKIIEDLQATDKLVVIGWSASDDYFADLINDNITDDQAELIIVDKVGSNGSNGIGAIIQKLSSKSPKKERKWKKITPCQEGFSGLWTNKDTMKSIFS